MIVSKNLELWDSVCKTDPNHTKPGKKGAYTFTCIAPMYQTKKATEAFGIQGIGWGIDPKSEKYSSDTFGTTIILNYDAVLFFIYDGVRGEIPIHASEKSCYQTQGANGYMKIDDEVRKKVVTNAKTKGLSELGISADVFMGEFDDPNYVDFRKYEEGVMKAEGHEDEMAQKKIEFNEWCKSEVSVYSAVTAKPTLDLVYAKHKQNLLGKCGLLGLEATKYIRAFDSAYNKQLEVIQGEKK